MMKNNEMKLLYGKFANYEHDENAELVCVMCRDCCLKIVISDN